MRSKNALIALALVSAGGLVINQSAKASAVVTFDNVTASPSFSGTTPGGPAGPIVTYSGVTFNGGVILNDSAFASEATTKSNLYATADIVSLADSSVLPGSITGTFTAPGLYNSVSMDIIDGSGGASFTLSAFNSSNALIGSDTIGLTGFGQLGSVGSAFINGPGISYFTVTTDQGAGNTDFAIDTVNLGGAAAVPEPSQTATFALGGFAVLGLLAFSRKRRAGSSVA